MEPIVFYLFSAVSVAGALGVILLPRPVMALLCLVLTMISLSVLYLLLGAQFVALANLIVYAGAVLILFLFVIMLQGLGAKDLPLRRRIPAPLLIGSLAVVALWVVAALAWNSGISWPRAPGADGSVRAVGLRLFSQYILPFEMTSLLLLLGVFAAVNLGNRERS